MTYQGIKFKNKIISDEVVTDPGLDELKKWCQKFHELKLAPPYEGGSYGNLSYRAENSKNEFIITGSRVGLKENMDNSSFSKVVSCDIKRGIARSMGPKEPSSESMLHFAIYEKRPDIGAIFHGHCENILNMNKNLPAKETTRKEPYGTRELVKSVIDILGKENFIIIKEHGFLAMGRNMSEAGRTALNAYYKCE